MLNIKDGKLNIKIAISHRSFSYYSPFEEKIYLRTHGKLNEDEIIELLTDTITHEFIHAILFNMFNDTITGLFDAIAYHFYQNYNLFNKSIKMECFRMSWRDEITFNKNAVKEHYHIDDFKFNCATFICNNKLNNFEVKYRRL